MHDPLFVKGDVLKPNDVLTVGGIEYVLNKNGKAVNSELGAKKGIQITKYDNFVVAKKDGKKTYYKRAFAV